MFEKSNINVVTLLKHIDKMKRLSVEFLQDTAMVNVETCSRDEQPLTVH